MFCSYCQRDFNDKLNTPRLLVVCGHTLCQSCCYRLHNNTKVECPECNSSTFIQSISLLPKNLALIARESSRDQCLKHHKKYEAFCEKENMLICIDCILHDGHKNHEMDGISNSYEKYNSQWGKKMEKILKYGEKISDFVGEVRQGYDGYKDMYVSVQDQISCFFRELKEIIDKQEENTIAKVKETFSQVQNKFQDKIRMATASNQTLHALIEQLVTYEHLGQTPFLQTFAERDQLYSSYSQQLEEPVKYTQLVFSKKATADALGKAFQCLIAEKTDRSEKKGVNLVTNYNSISSQLKKSEGVSSSNKVVRKVPAPTVTPAQARKKVSTKRQLQTPQPQKQCISINRVTPSSKDPKDNAKEANCRELAEQIKHDISGVDPKESLCHSFMSNMTSFLTQRKSIYLIGGFNEEANNIVKLNLFSFNWEEVCSLTSNRSKFGCVATEDKQIHLFGGKKGKERVGDTEVFSLGTNRWLKSSTQICKKRSGFSVISLGQFQYFIGGNDGDNILNTVQTLNLATNEWKRREPMLQARDELSVVANKGKIYAIGGFGGRQNQPLKSVQVYDPLIEKWKQIPAMNQPRRALAAAVLADGIYAIGGFDGNNYLSSVQKFQEGNRQWTSVASMNQPRCTHSAVSIFQSQQIYVFGGFDYVPLDSVERYNVVSNEWEPVCRMPTVRFMHSSLLLKQD